MTSVFRKGILDWHQDIDRNLPWKQTTDPYKIWISEIILQQTRVAYGIQYYLKITSLFPTVHDLANASEQDVLSAWKGLGYYARARNMHAAAQQIVNDYDGIFPSTYDDIITLKGVGPYTAAAIASFGFGLPHAVLDGNVFRVLSRHFGEETPIDSTEGKYLFATLAQECLSTDQPASYNQAIMDFGALVCKPAVPLCTSCPLNSSCQALDRGIVDLLPIKSKKIKIKKRFFNYFIFQKGNKVLLQCREQKDIWKGLFEPPQIETEKQFSKKDILSLVQQSWNIDQENIALKKISVSEQRLTHRLIIATFYKVNLSNMDLVPSGDWMSITDLSHTAMPKVVDDALKSFFFSPTLFSN